MDTLSSDIMPAFSTMMIGLGLVALLLLTAGCALDRGVPSYKSWAAYYGSSAAPEAFLGYDVVVLDSDRHPDVAAIKAQGSVVLAYISLGEVAPYRSYAQEVATWPGFVLDTNEDWGSQIIDIRQPAWKDYVTKTWLPMVMANGFDGVMIDTLDTSLALEEKDREAYAGMSEAAIGLIRALRNSLPRGKLIMVNRGFEIVPDIAGDIDIVLAESILINSAKKDKPFFEETVIEKYNNMLQELRSEHRHLSIFALDYPDLSDKTTIDSVRRQHKKQGFIPYISTIDLQEIRPYGPGQ